MDDQTLECLKHEARNALMCLQAERRKMMQALLRMDGFMRRIEQALKGEVPAKKTWWKIWRRA